MGCYVWILPMRHIIVTLIPFSFFTGVRFSSFSIFVLLLGNFPFSCLICMWKYWYLCSLLLSLIFLVDCHLFIHSPSPYLAFSYIHRFHFEFSFLFLFIVVFIVIYCFPLSFLVFACDFPLPFLSAESNIFPSYSSYFSCSSVLSSFSSFLLNFYPPFSVSYLHFYCFRLSLLLLLLPCLSLLFLFPLTTFPSLCLLSLRYVLPVNVFLFIYWFSSILLHFSFTRFFFFCSLLITNSFPVLSLYTFSWPLLKIFILYYAFLSSPSLFFLSSLSIFLSITPFLLFAFPLTPQQTLIFFSLSLIYLIALSYHPFFRQVNVLPFSFLTLPYLAFTNPIITEREEGGGRGRGEKRKRGEGRKNGGYEEGLKVGTEGEGRKRREDEGREGGEKKTREKGEEEKQRKRGANKEYMKKERVERKERSDKRGNKKEKIKGEG